MCNPKVSIIIPVFNGNNYLENAINCALSQTYENIEVIVVNDGSTDNGATAHIAERYGSRIRYFEKTNGGVSSALNYGITKMTGDYFSWLSHDDGYSPNKIKDSIELLKKKDVIGEKVVAFTGGYFIDSTGVKLKNFRGFFDCDTLYSGVKVASIMAQKGVLNGCCMLIPKSAFIDVGGFDESLRYSQDALMWYQIFLSGYSLLSDNRPNVMYRLHKNQTSQLRRDLFEHDSLVIARLLLDKLAFADQGHRLLFKYIKRLTKYSCNQAIDYMCTSALKKAYLSRMDIFRLKIYKVVGYFRYRIVTLIKKTLIMLKG